MPDGNHRDAEFGVRSGVTAFDTVERIVRRERGEHAVRVVEQVFEIMDQLGFGFRRIVTTLFAVLGRLLALKFVKEGKLGTGDVLHLFPEATDPTQESRSRLREVNGQATILLFLLVKNRDITNNPRWKPLPR